jgi:hypothetical protein
LAGKGEATKAFHHRLERVGLQESSPQNNFRRIIACRIPKSNFCNHTINYTTEAACSIDLALMLFVLNSSFADGYFRLGSTQSVASHLRNEEFELLEKECLEAAAGGTCDATMQHVIISLVNCKRPLPTVAGLG